MSPQGLAAARAARAELLELYFLVLRAEVQGRGGRSEAGLTVVREPLARVEGNRAGWWAAQPSRLQGTLLLPHTAPGLHHVEPCFHQALDIARHQHAKAIELRAAMSLRRLQQHQGKRGEARAPLAPAYGWFTEGLPPDLQDAQALLDAPG